MLGARKVVVVVVVVVVLQGASARPEVYGE